MSCETSTIIDHWEKRCSLERIDAALEQAGIDPTGASPAQLAAHDQLHSGTLASTRDFADWVRIEADCRVLDLGAGLGGSARFLAAELGARVTALELCPELHTAALELTRRAGLADRVDHQLGDCTAHDAAGTYDLVWIQHVDMQVEDKAALYRNAVRSLALGGRVVWHDWLAGPGGEPRYPLMWSADGSISFLSDEARFRAQLAAAGLELMRLESIVERTREWLGAPLPHLDRAIDRPAAADDEPASRRRAHLQNLRAELKNAIAGVDEQRLVPFFGEARRPLQRSKE